MCLVTTSRPPRHRAGSGVTAGITWADDDATEGGRRYVFTG